jgi:hypothetical protein
MDHDCLGLVSLPADARPAVSTFSDAAPPPPFPPPLLSAAAAAAAVAIARPKTPLQSINRGFFSVIEVRNSPEKKIHCIETRDAAAPKTVQKPRLAAFKYKPRRGLSRVTLPPSSDFLVSSAAVP